MKESGTSLPRGRVVVLARDLSVALRIGTPRRLVPAPSPLQAAAELLAAPADALVIDLALLPPRHLRLLQLARQLGVPAWYFGSPLPGLLPDQLDAQPLPATPDAPAAGCPTGCHAPAAVSRSMLASDRQSPITPAADPELDEDAESPTHADLESEKDAVDELGPNDEYESLATTRALKAAQAAPAAAQSAPSAPQNPAPAPSPQATAPRPAELAPAKPAAQPDPNQINLEELGLAAFTPDPPAAPAAHADPIVNSPASLLTPEELSALLEREP